MNIVGCVLFIIAGILAIIFPRIGKKQGLEDYSGCATAMGEVAGTEDFCGERWMVCFTDANGREVLGMDDVIAVSSFSHKYKRPKRRTTEAVYYYPRTENGFFKLNGRRVEYYIHFCNEDLYELQKHVTKRDCVIGILLGIAFMICAVLILIFG